MNTKKLIKLLTFLLAALLCVSAFAGCAANKNEAKYQEACDKLEAGDYEAAYALFTELGDYKDAAKQASYFRYIPVSHYTEYTSDDENGTITYTVTLNDQNLPATVVEEYSDGFKNTCTYTYNEFGFVMRRESSDTEGNTSSYEATFDARGNVITVTRSYSDGTVGTLECTYNDKDELIKVVTNNMPIYYYDSYTSTYDAEGREIKVVFDYQGEISIEETTYNEAGKILKKTWSYEDGEVYSINDYIYDEAGRLVEIRFTEEGEDGGFKKTTYNEKDQMITEHVFYTFDHEYTNNYEYDEHGNIVKTTYERTSSEDGLYQDVTESTYKLVYLPFDYTEEDWIDVCDSTQCWDSTHW